MLRKGVCCLVLVMVLACLVSAAVLFVGINTMSYATELNRNEYDVIFLQSCQELIEKQYDGDYTLVSDKELIYDIHLKEFGYLYEFTVNGEKGYGIVVSIDNVICLQEIFFNSKYPFQADADNKKVYVNQMIYLEFDDEGNYLLKGKVINEEELYRYKNIAYASSGGEIRVEQETLFYSTKNVVSDYSLAYKIPSCTAETNLGSNICVPVAGANIIQYYDRYLTNLIPNYIPGRGMGNIYMYNLMNDNLRDVIRNLYIDMQTNTTVSGTTINQFKNGLLAYCGQRGYSVDYITCMSGGEINFAQVKTNLDNLRPVIVFVSSFTYTEDMANEAGKDVLSHSTYIADHSVVAFGYKEIEYTFSDGRTNTVNMVEVSTGISSLGSGYLNLSKSNIIDDAMAIDIY